MLREQIYRLGGWRFWALTLTWFVLGLLSVPFVWLYHGWVVLWFWNRWGRKHVTFFWLLLANVFIGAQIAVLADWMIGLGMVLALFWLMVAELLQRSSLEEWIQEVIFALCFAASFVFLQGIMFSVQNWILSLGFVMVVLLFNRVSSWRKH